MTRRRSSTSRPSAKTGTPADAPVAGAAGAAGGVAFRGPGASIALPASFLIVFDEPHLTLEQARTARAFVAAAAPDAARRRPRDAGGGPRRALVERVGPKGARGLARAARDRERRARDARERERADDALRGDAHRARRQPRRAASCAAAAVRMPAPRTRVSVAGARRPGAAARPRRLRRGRAAPCAPARARRRLAGASTRASAAARRRCSPPAASWTTRSSGSTGSWCGASCGAGVTAYFFDARALALGTGIGADQAGAYGRSRAAAWSWATSRQRDEELRLQPEAVDGDASGAWRLADETGGFTIRVSDASGLGRLALDARQYYLLGYAPTNTQARRPAAAHLRRASRAGRERPRAQGLLRPEPERTSAWRGRRGATAARRGRGRSRYVALVQARRAPGGPAALEALRPWSPRALRRAVAAVAADPGCPPECRQGRRAAAHGRRPGPPRRGGRRRPPGSSVSSRPSCCAACAERRSRPTSSASGTTRSGIGSSTHGRVPTRLETFAALVKLYPEDPEARLAQGRADEAGLYVLSLVARPSRASQPELSSVGFDTTATSARARERPHHWARKPTGAPRSSRIARRSGSSPRSPRLGCGSGGCCWLDGKLDEAERELAAVAGGPSPDGRQLAHLFLARIEDERGRLPRGARPRPGRGRGAPALAVGPAAARRPAATQRPDRGRPAHGGPGRGRARRARTGADGWLRYNLGAGERSARRARGDARDGAAVSRAAAGRSPSPRRPRRRRSRRGSASGGSRRRAGRGGHARRSPGGGAHGGGLRGPRRGRAPVGRARGALARTGAGAAAPRHQRRARPVTSCSSSTGAARSFVEGLAPEDAVSAAVLLLPGAPARRAGRIARAGRRGTRGAPCGRHHGALRRRVGGDRHSPTRGAADRCSWSSATETTA